MAEPILDINDTNLGLWLNGELGLSSPGYALLQGEEYSFGEAAKAEARRHPRQINHRYWSQLDTEPLNPPFGPGRHTADLVHSHLLSIYQDAGRPEKVIVAAPGSLQYNQLALLLGIVEQCPFNVAGLVDRAVAAAARHPVKEYNWHVELQLNQALLTGMRWENGQLIRDNMVPIPGSGWLALQDSLTRAIAEAFIQQTRFDPRRSATNEQALYDVLPAILQKLKSSSETNVDLDGRQARVERANLAEACSSHYQRLLRTITAADAQIFLGSTMEGLPALAQQLPGSIQCSPQAVSEGVAQCRDLVLADDAGVHFITSLPAQGVVAGPAPAAEPAPEPEQIPASRCQIEFRGGNLTIQPVSGPALSVNGTPLSGAGRLTDGDLLELPDGSAWKLVEVQHKRENGT
jgi:hypothetical protein